MGTTTSARVQKHRTSLRASGLRPIQIWVPDTRSPKFLAECRRQSTLVSIAERNDQELMEFLDDALTDIGEE